MAKENNAKPKRRLRLGRILTGLVVLAVAGGGVYGASWLNAQRYYLVVGPTEARVEKGRMLPTGHAPFAPADPQARKAYRTIPLPGGMNLARGTSTFTERVDLDQAIFQLLKQATEFTLSQDNQRTPELAQRYLVQVRALTGVTVEQQLQIQKLERDAQYVRARGLVESAQRGLAEAEKLFDASSRGGGSRHADGAVRAHAIREALRSLTSPMKPTVRPAPPPAPPPAATATATSTAP